MGNPTPETTRSAMILFNQLQPGLLVLAKVIFSSPTLQQCLPLVLYQKGYVIMLSVIFLTYKWLPSCIKSNNFLNKFIDNENE